VTRSKAGAGAGKGSACRAGAPVTKSVGKVGVSGAGGEGVRAGDDGVGSTSELLADCGIGLCRMSRICCLKLEGNLARTSGWKPCQKSSSHAPRDMWPQAMRCWQQYQKTVVYCLTSSLSSMRHFDVSSTRSWSSCLSSWSSAGMIL